MTWIGCAIGDLHFDKLTKYWPDANHRQAMAVKSTVADAKREGATRLFLLGDIAEGVRDTTGNAMRLSEGAQVEFFDLLCHLDSEIETHVYLGNHDWASDGHHSLQVFLSMYRRGVFKRVHFYDTMTKTKLGGVRCAIMPFPHTEPPKGTELAFAHYEVSGAVGDNGRQVHSKDEHKYRCPVIQGHLHTHQRVRNHYYPGTLYQTNFGENEDKGYALFQAGGDFKYRWVSKRPPFKLVNVRINRREDFKQLVADDHVKYKLFVHEDVRIPDGLMERFPNIVNRLMFATEQDAAALEQNEFLIESNQVDVDSDALLPDFLKSEGATRTQIKRGREIVADYRSSGGAGK